MTALFRITGFAGSRRLLTTTHRTEASASIEIAAWQNRMKNNHKGGEIVTHAELVDLRKDGNLTIPRVIAGTEIPWSWKK